MRIGLIGFGFMGGVHLSAIERVEGATLAAVSSRTRPTADTPAKGNLPQLKSGVIPPDTKWYYNWQELLDDPDIDAVDICLPTHLHKQVAIAAFERGKHVLCEKPMALTSPDCDVILEAAKKSGRTFMVGHVLRFMFPYRYAASFVESTCHGSVKACTLERKTGYPRWSEWLASEASSGGAILDLLCHDIDQALKLFGAPMSVRARSDGEIDTMLGILRYGSGLEVHVDGGWYAPGLPFSSGFEILAEDAALSLKAGKLQLRQDGVEQAIDIPEHQEYFEQMAYFVECCTTNAAPELCPPAESAEAVRVATLLKASRDRNGEELSCEL